jgi:hypothetical protein
MKKRPPHPKKEPQTSCPSELPEIRLEPSGVVVVEHQSTPPTGPADKQIHPRRPLPLVPEAPARPEKKDNKKS